MVFTKKISLLIDRYARFLHFLQIWQGGDTGLVVDAVQDVLHGPDQDMRSISRAGKLQME
jgi:hypothetical protein